MYDRPSLNGNITSLSDTIRHIGSVYNGSNTNEAVSVPHNTATLVSTLTLQAGVYLFVACIDWGANESGYRQVATATPTNPGRRVAVTSIPVPGTNKQTYQQLVEIISISGSEDVNVYGIQTSGNALNAYPWVYAVKIR